MMRGINPLIGITVDSAGGPGDHPTSAQPALVLPRRYTAAVERCGGAPLLLPFTGSEPVQRRYLDTIDGLIVSGGNFDIPPRLYGERAIKQIGRLIPERTAFELKLIRLALRRDLPVLGICGGAQAINVVLGGSLYQDIAAQLAGAREHQLADLKDSGRHRVEITQGTLLHRIVRRRNLEVNTTHHQAVKQLGGGLVVNAIAADGVIEGIESTRHSFVLGIQWHPESLMQIQQPQRRLFSAFLASCLRYRRGGKF